MEQRDLKCYSHENLFEQVKSAPFERGHYRVTFYVKKGLISREPTSEVAEFYYFPSAGTIRDTAMNIVMYSARLDKYHIK